MLKITRHLFTVAIAICAVCILLSSYSFAENYAWDCPECGRTGNTGNYCGGCAHPAPWTETTIILMNTPTRVTHSPSHKVTFTPKPTPSLTPRCSTATPAPTLFKPSPDSVLTTIKIGYACHGKIIWTEDRQVYTGEQWIEGNLGNYNYVFMGEDETYWNKTNNNNVRYDKQNSNLRPYYIDWSIASPTKASIKMNITTSMAQERGVNVIFNVKFSGKTIPATISKSKFQYRNLPGGNSTYKAIYGVKGQTINIYAKKRDAENQWWVLFDADLNLRTESLEVDPNQKPVEGIIESWWTPVNECLDISSFNLDSVPLYDNLMAK